MPRALAKRFGTDPTRWAFGNSKRNPWFFGMGESRVSDPSVLNLPRPIFGTLQLIIPFRQSEMLGLKPFQNPQKVSFCRVIDSGILAGAGASHVENLDPVFRDPFPNFLVGAWSLQAQDQDGSSQLLAAGPGQKGASSEDDFLGWALNQDECPVGVLCVASGPFGILGGLSFLKFVASWDDPILGFAAFGAPATVRDA